MPADSLRLKDWYLAGANQTVSRLQWIVDSGGDYVPGSTDALRNSRVSVLDFGQLVTGYDAGEGGQYLARGLVRRRIRPCWLLA